MGEPIWVSIQGPGMYLHIMVCDLIDRLIVENAIQICAKRVQEKTATATATAAEGRKDE